ncbi:hypothetical protein D918_02020 [Trichuris suis]|nr:hypothetical protein D918_02020 [Trichuris suis]
MKGRFTPCSESSPDPDGRKFRARRPTGFTGNNPTIELPFIHERSPIEGEPIHRRHNVYKYPEKSPDEVSAFFSIKSNFEGEKQRPRMFMPCQSNFFLTDYCSKSFYLRIAAPQVPYQKIYPLQR